MHARHVHAEAAPGILVHRRIADERPARAPRHADVAALGPTAGEAAVPLRRGHPRCEAAVLCDPLVVARLEILPQVLERLEVHRDRDAGEPAVAGEDVGDLVVEQRELGGVGRRAVGAEEAGDVAVVEGPIRRRLVLERGRHRPRDARVAAVRADHDVGVGAAAVGELHAGDAVAVTQDAGDVRVLLEVDGLGRAGDQDGVERRPADREAVAVRARILGRRLLRLRPSVRVVELPGQRRAAEGENAVEHAEPLEHADHPGAAKEMRRRCRAREPARSSSSTETPASPSSAARVEPPMRAPTTMTS